MNKLVIYILLFSLFVGEAVVAQKTGRKNKNKSEQTTNSDAELNAEVSIIFIDATKAKLLGDTDKATKLYESCLAKNPAHAASMYELAQIAFTRGDYSTAASYAQKAAETEPENKWYKLLLIEIYNKAGMNRELLEVCKTLVEQDPASVDYLYELSNAYLMNNDGDNAIKIYNRIEELIGVTEEISLQKQRIFLIEKKTSKAAAEIEKLIKEFPDEETRYISMLAEMYNNAGEPDEAARYYKLILEKDPENPYIHITLSDYYRQKGDKARSFEEMKLGFANSALDIDTKIRVLIAFFTAENYYEENKADIFELAQILVRTHPGEPKAHSMYADFLLDDKKYAEARDEYRKVIAVDSSKYAVWEGLLNAEIQLSDFNAVEDESSRAMELFPLLPVPYLFNGIALLEQKKYDKAISRLSDGAKLVSGNNLLLVQFYTYLGDAGNRIKNYSLSDESYEKALKIDPENSFVLNNYAYYLSLRNEKLDKAETMSAKAVKLDPTNAANMDTYGWVLYKLGKYAEALSWVEKALAATPVADADLLEHLGDIYYKLGKTTEAQQQWEKALNAGGGSELLEKKVKDKKLYE